MLRTRRNIVSIISLALLSVASAQALSGPASAAAPTIAPAAAAPGAAASGLESKQLMSGSYSGAFDLTAAECAAIKQADPAHAASPDICKVSMTGGSASPVVASAAQVAALPPAAQPNTQCGNHVCTVYYRDVHLKMCAGVPLIGCYAWHQTINARFFFDSVWVWANMWGINGAYVDCSDEGGVGVDVTTTWCGWWNNPMTWGNPSAMDAGVNYKVAGLVQGSPINQSRWARIDLWPNGAYRFRSG